MWSIRAALIFIAIFWLLSGAANASGEATKEEDICGPGLLKDETGTCMEPGAPLQQTLPQNGIAPQPVAQKAHTANFAVYLFWGKGCPHCEKELLFLESMKRDIPEMDIRDFEVWYHSENASLLANLLKAHDMRVSGVPVTFIDKQVFVGFSGRARSAIGDAIRSCLVRRCADPKAMMERKALEGTSASPTVSGAPITIPEKQEEGMSVDLPLIGLLDARQTSLPVVTIMIAGLDSINPCAFFVLLSLLGLLVHARSRARMFLIGGVFVFFSGLIYYLFMAAWLNLFLIMGQVAVITTIAGCVSVLIAVINIKDYFFFKQGVSLTIPDSARPRLFDRMRKLLHAASLPSILAGTTVLAIVANSYELLCTAGFPMVFTRILTLHAMSATTYYLYLALYAFVYAVPLFLIVAGMSITLGSRKLTELQGRVLKLISGSMMLGLGVVLIINPALLNSLLISGVLLAASVAVSGILYAVDRRLRV